VTVESLPAELMQRFRIADTIGDGDTGTLLRAEEPQSGRSGVIKILKSRALSSASERQRLKRELVKQSTLANPHLALPVVTGEAGGTLWLFRDWIDGETLRDRLDRDGPLPTPESLSVAAQIAAALDELHRAGLLHRDLQPGHIMLSAGPGGVPKVTLIDAGLAGRIETDTVFDVLGTPAYVSPEQAKGKLVSFRSDLYALGCVLFEMGCGKPPYAGSVKELLDAHANSEPSTPSSRTRSAPQPGPRPAPVNPKPRSWECRRSAADRPRRPPGRTASPMWAR
jgi:serine/threonine-protein kinase